MSSALSLWVSDLKKVDCTGCREAEKGCGIVVAMATVDKTSVREEVNRLKKEFEQLCSEGKVSSEIRVLMSSLLMIVELILSCPSGEPACFWLRKDVTIGYVKAKGE